MSISIANFIKEEIVTRAIAARELRDGLKVNDISIMAGCDADGIQIYSGIEQIAEIMDEELHEDVYSAGEYAAHERWFTYGTDKNDAVKFYQRDYIKMSSEQNKAIKPKEEF